MIAETVLSDMLLSGVGLHFLRPPWGEQGMYNSMLISHPAIYLCKLRQMVQLKGKFVLCSKYFLDISNTVVFTTIAAFEEDN